MIDYSVSVGIVFHFAAVEWTKKSEGNEGKVLTDCWSLFLVRQWD